MGSEVTGRVVLKGKRSEICARLRGENLQQKKLVWSGGTSSTTYREEREDRGWKKDGVLLIG